MRNFYANTLKITLLFTIVVTTGCVSIVNLNDANGNTILLGNGNVLSSTQQKAANNIIRKSETEVTRQQLSSMDRNLKAIYEDLSLSNSLDAPNRSDFATVYDQTVSSIQSVQLTLQDDKVKNKVVKRTLNPQLKKIKKNYDYLMSKAEPAKFQSLSSSAKKFWDTIIPKTFGYPNRKNTGIPDELKISTMGRLKSLIVTGDREGCDDNDLSLIESYYQYPFKTLSILRQAPSLQELTFTNNDLEDISDLKYCPILEQLYLDCNLISDLSQIPRLDYLKVLSIKNNSIENLDGIKNLPHLMTLNCLGNEITDITAIIEYRKLYPESLIQLKINTEYLSLAQIEELQSLFNHQITDGHEKLLLI